MKSLYIHIPFCKEKCAYCDFPSFKLENKNDISDYIDHLIIELSFYSDTGFETVYIGGGTPSIIGIHDCKRLFKKVEEVVKPVPWMEYTVEANPESLSEESLKIWMDHGVNRISLGVQSFDDKVLAGIKRLTRRRDIQYAAELLYKRDVQNFNIDLILGIQGKGIFKTDLKRAVSLKPAHMSVYLLSISASTPIKRMIKENSINILPDEGYEDLYYYTEDVLADSGYERYEVSNYSKPGFESRHNLNYWNGGEYIGVGLSAVSAIGNRRTKNCENIIEYYKIIEEGMKPVSETEYITPKKRAYEKIMLSLRTSMGIELRELIRLTAEDKLKNLFEFIDMLNKKGYTCSTVSGSLVLSKKGLFRSNSVIVEIWRFIKD